MPNWLQLILLPTLLEGYYSSGKRQPRGTISHFLCGIQDGDIFRSFCRVGSGVSQKDLYDLGILIHIHCTELPSNLRNFSFWLLSYPISLLNECSWYFGHFDKLHIWATIIVSCLSWVQVWPDLTLLFTNRFWRFYPICRNKPNPSQNFFHSHSEMPLGFQIRVGKQ